MIAEMEKWNDRLVAALKMRQKSQADLIKITGAKGSSINEWVSGKTKNMQADNAVKVCSFLKINIDWLLFGRSPSGLEENASAHVWLTADELSCLKMLNEMEEGARKHWISIGASLPKEQKEKTPTAEAVDTNKILSIKLGQLDDQIYDHGPDLNQTYDKPAEPEQLKGRKTK